MLFFVRLYLYLTVATVIVSLILFIVLRDKRYLRFIWQLIKFSLVLFIVLMALYALGRVILY